MKLTFLGTADSAGIPVHNCDCIACKEYIKNNRTNLSNCAFIEINGTHILLDAGLDELAFYFNGKTIGSIYLTHFHADHCLGLLRLRHSKQIIHCFHPKDKTGFSDLYKHPHSIRYNEIEPFETRYDNGIEITPIPLEHSKNTFGYVIAYNSCTMVYLTDCFSVPKKSMEFLKNTVIDYAFIDACYDEKTTQGNHLNYLQATQVLDELQVKQGYLMHLSHSTLSYILSNNIELKYPYVNPLDTFYFK